jgi:NAD(P)-dependent dehydrogenase (short-subunit alcohol dehydrogenase family)
MRAAGSGRVISLSSVGGIIGQPFNDAYCAAKFAVEGMMESLAPVARRFGIFVSIVEPGAVNTSFVASVAGKAGGLMAVDDDPYRPILDAYLGATRQAFSGGQVGDDVAKVILEAATAAQPHLRYQTSPTARRVAELKFADPDGDSVLAAAFERLGAG